MRILIVDPYYPSFLNTFYLQNTNLSYRSYDEQWRILMDQCFSTADFYSSNLMLLGHEATEVIANCEPLQSKWAEEHSLKIDQPRWRISRRVGFIPWLRRIREWFYPILEAQIIQYHPDILYIQDMNRISVGFLRKVKPHLRLLVGQIACPIGSKTDFSEYDLILSSFPHFVDRFRREGLSSEYLKLGFDPRILPRLKKDNMHYPVVFVGGLSTNHMERMELLSYIAESQTIDLWGYGFGMLPERSKLGTSHHGEAWGLDMYKVLYHADIALNNHIYVAENYANNSRLYEVTGVGTLLLTDDKDNMHSLFEPGKEVVAYHSAEECVELINYYLEHEEERKTIAQAGQTRTLQEHTYYHRMQELVDILEHYLS
jgi:spore maturation protein CgeB